MKGFVQFIQVRPERHLDEELLCWKRLMASSIRPAEKQGKERDVVHNNPPGGNLLDLLLLLDEHGVEPVRHGAFVGFKNVRRLTPELKRLADQHCDDLRRFLRNSPTPYEVRESCHRSTVGRCDRQT
jgi:hypothetical protein